MKSYLFGGGTETDYLIVERLVVGFDEIVMELRDYSRLEARVQEVEDVRREGGVSAHLQVDENHTFWILFVAVPKIKTSP